MHRGQSGKRFFIAPDASRARWMVQVEQEALYAGWLDATDWADNVLTGFVESKGESINQEQK